MLPHLLTNARPVGGIHDVDRHRSDFVGSSNNPVQAQSAAAARARYEASLAVRENEENVVRQGEVDDTSPFAKVPTTKTKTAAITYLCNAESERPR